ncbi:PREDICTED: farnesol dehydrogenase-like [Trachymyrmex cornetzi]|uniref:farnesol dehydrogenase-like n=1 Tax=Trachymyrmex cornetzi TaxID=471704 RepID=UPI00084F1E23|nr:PREDICTED: farnesol dehydrogenase-like [Trachymyrmex cornetzi]
MDRWLGKTAVVTGAGSGLGEAITRALLRNGVNVVALEVLKERLAKLDADCKRERFPGKLYTICCDVTREDEINAAFLQIETLGGVDIMVNNAGIIETSRIIDSNRKTFEKILNTNVLAVAVCMNKAVCSMRKRNGEGHIFNINSIASHHRIPNELFECNVYFSSKHASLAPTNTVRREVGKIKAPIRVTGISPGVVKTNIIAHEEGLKNFFEKEQHILPEDVADAIIYALGTRPIVQITELSIQPTGELM